MDPFKDFQKQSTENLSNLYHQKDLAERKIRRARKKLIAYHDEKKPGIYLTYPRHFPIQTVQRARELEKQYNREATELGGFWVNASSLEFKIRRYIEVAAQISLSEYHGDLVEWQRTAEGRKLAEQVLARGYRAGTFLDKWLFIGTQWPWCEPLSNRPVGLEDRVSGGSEAPLRFKSQLMWDYGSWDCAGRAWCPILGQYLDADEVTVSQLFPKKKS